MLVLLACAVLVAGCGGGGDDDGGDGGGAGTPNYDAGFQTCEQGVRATADLYAVEPTREAVADIVTEQLAGGSGAQDEQEIREGCLAALDAAAE
jgi:hypothetical protein